MKKYLFLVFLLLVTGCVSTMPDPSASLPVNINGEWEGLFADTMENNANTRFMFEKQEDALTGFVILYGTWIPMEEGKIKGNKISFKIKTKAGGNFITSFYRGEVKGDEIKMWCGEKFKGGTPGAGRYSKGTVKRVK